LIILPNFKNILLNWPIILKNGCPGIIKPQVRQRTLNLSFKSIAHHIMPFRGNGRVPESSRVSCLPGKNHFF
jgi:hypothetical protein